MERIIIKIDSSLDSAIDNESRISSTHYHTLDTKQYSLKACSTFSETHKKVYFETKIRPIRIGNVIFDVENRLFWIENPHFVNENLAKGLFLVKIGTIERQFKI